MPPAPKNPSLSWVVKPLIAEELYTDREEFLEYFHTSARAAAGRRTLSTVMLGHRRMGKTEIFKRVVNRLFFEQDPKSPDAVIPVYFSFPDGPMNPRQFGVRYLENFIRYYVGFQTRQPDLVAEKAEGENLLYRIRDSRALFPFSKRLDLLLDGYETVRSGRSVLPHQTALEIPRRISDIDDSTIAMFLDEFQNTRLPQYDFDITGFMQEAVESPTCPHFVTGSAMSILAREIIGRGSLFGRFDSREIEPMSAYWSTTLAQRAARYYGAAVSDLMAPVVGERCGGNPFYIDAVVRQAANTGVAIEGEDALNRILAVDLSSGFIWGELNDQVTRWIDRINEHGITKWVLYLSALEENTDAENRDRLDIQRIQTELKAREGREVSLEQIRDVLIRLSRGDLLEYMELGGWFHRVRDPILLEFLKVWGRIEVEGQNRNEVRFDLINRYAGMKRRFSEYRGYLAEVHMSQVLLNGQRKTLPARFFNSPADVEMPSLFIYVRHRVRLGSGKGQEIDVLGAADSAVWVCQSKWITGKRIGVDVLKSMREQGEAVREEMNPNTLRIWIFANDGLTKQAQTYAEKHGIFWSARREFDELLAYIGLRRLPELN